MIQFLIIDDEPIAHRIIEGYCNNLPHLEKAGNCYNAFEAMQLLNKQQVAIVFLDINMPKLSGFDFLKTLVNPPKIIVTTAYKEYALEGYDLNVSDYLLKPFSFERFVKAINKTIIEVPINTQNTSIAATETSKQFYIKGDKKQYKINTENILYIEAYGNYTKIYFKDEMIVSHERISDFEVLLAQKKFLRVHKSFIVALDKIKHIEGNRIIIESHTIPIGQTYKSSISKLYKS